MSAVTNTSSSNPDEFSHAGSPARLALLLFLLLVAFYALTSSGRVRNVDEYMMYDQTESLVLRQSLSIPQSVMQHNFFGVYDRFGQPRPPYPPGLALVAAPAYAAGVTVVSAMHLPLPQAMYMLQFMTCMTSAVLAAGVVVVLFLLLFRLGFTHRTALATSMLVALTTMLWPYAGYFFSEPLATLLLMLTALVLFGVDEPQTRFSWRALVLAGVLLGALVWVRFYHILALVAFCPALIAVEKRLRPALIVASIASLSLGLYLVYNRYLYGGFFRFPYPGSVEAGTHPASFPTPFFVGVSGMLFSPGKSVFLFVPLLIPALWGLKQLWQRNKGLGIVVSSLPFIYLFFFAKYVEWEGGRTPGPRYLLPPAILLCLAVAPLFESASLRQRIALRTAAVAGFLIQIVTIATSFVEAQVGQGYYNHLVEYQFSYCQLAVQSRLFWRYATGASQPLRLGWDFYGGKYVDLSTVPGLPQQLDMGWDRWFVFLHRTGIPMQFIARVLTVECLAVAVFAWLLFREYRRASVVVS